MSADSNLQSADEDCKAAVGLEGSHVQVGDEVHDSYRPGHKGDLVLLIPQKLDHLQQKKGRSFMSTACEWKIRMWPFITLKQFLYPFYNLQQL